MAVFLQIDQLTKSYGDRLLFEDVTFGINEGDKIGVIAKNGTGKSTLLAIIAGIESADSGTVTARNGLRIGYLEQTPRFNQGETVIEACMKGARHHEEDDDTLRAGRLLSQLGINDTSATVDHLSGGQLKRIAIARLLLAEPDLMILDEPTNHLDIGVIEWLENYLCRSRSTLLMVTHDRYFLERVCTKIIEIDRRHIYTCDGTWAEYLRRRTERIEALTGELAKVRNTLRRETEWMRRQPQARAGKAKYRIDQYYDLKERSRMDLKERNVKLDVNSSYIGSKIFEARNVGKAYGDKVILRDFSYVFSRYERLGIVGPNGVGKSTFIKMLQGIVPPDSGSWDIGETVRFGYYSQDGISFDERKRVIDAVTEFCEDVVVNDNVHYSPMQFLQRFLFSPADQQKYIATLSGGERARLHLATVLMRSPNFLILDEPTNDLDIVTLGILEEYLRDFKGCLIVISHDRFFLDLIVDHLFVMEGDGKLRDFPGGYTDYRKALKEENEAKQTEEKKQTAPQRTARHENRSDKLTFRERRELEQLTAEIDELEAEKAKLDALFASGEQVDDITALSTRYSEITGRLDEITDRWLLLSEKS